MALTKVVMPKLSDAMETGKVLKWFKQEGDRVEGGDIIAEIETDKADIELEAFGSGVLRKILIGPGSTVAVGATIAVIAEPDEEIGAALEGAPPAVTAAKPAVAPEPVPAGERAEGPVPAVEEAEEAEEAEAAPASGRRLKASPLARKVAGKAGVDLALVPGSGPGGRVIRRDVEAYLETGPAAAPAAPREEHEDVPLTAIRATIAKRMAQAKAPVPHFYLTTEIAMDRAVALREELAALPDAPRPTVTDLIIRAATLTLLRHPGVNASYRGEAIRRFRRVHIGIAVALEEGLITPVLRDCDRKGLLQIAREARDLIERARQRKLRAPELSGATFTVSNLGMFDIDEFSAIINPPEGAILAVGAIVEKPVVEEGRIGIGRRMRVTLSCDHRAMDGAMGARFLKELKGLLEVPLALLV
ncbi:MAG: 2-oxo acid dehydrogenase subunit E2 [Candidatus Rokubacteria bacterium]|nr:2-oxo acid dehydrogenase subunit E2 [Candidatus Rokubacteria bacterium]